MNDKTTEKKFIHWADLIRAAAIYLTIMVHVSGQMTSRWGKIPDSQWIIANVYGGVARVSVPLFFMISGYLLLPRSESLKVFYGKRIMKILIPLVVWSLIYLGWYCGNHPNTCTPNFIGNLLLIKGAYYHLWFLYSLLGIYLILPVLRLIIRGDPDKKLLWYLILLWLVFQPVLALTHKFWNFDINLRAPLAGGFVGYFILGYLLGEIPLSRIRIIISAIILFVATLITIIGTYLLTRDLGKLDGFFYDFVSLNVILASGATFILLRWVSETHAFSSPSVQALLRSLAATAFGVYLIHALVIELLSDWTPFVHVNSFMGNAIWSIPLVSAIVWILSFPIVRLLQKIPVVKQIVP
ncbi:MAG TPA: acyltransferase family protein [Anaerolineales bacterium]|nr:acyltransferase family protein [Anaerolineales bacterium]